MDLKTYREIYKKVSKVTKYIEPVGYVRWSWDYFWFKCYNYLTLDDVIKLEKIANEYGFSVEIYPVNDERLSITFTKRG